MWILVFKLMILDVNSSDILYNNSYNKLRQELIF